MIRLLKILVARGLLVAAASASETSSCGSTDEERKMLGCLGARIGIGRRGGGDADGPTTGDDSPKSINAGGSP
jgi:hypothetical protein